MTILYLNISFGEQIKITEQSCYNGCLNTIPFGWEISSEYEYVFGLCAQSKNIV